MIVKSYLHKDIKGLVIAVSKNLKESTSFDQFFVVVFFDFHT